MWIPLIDNARYPVRCIIRRPLQGGGITIVFDRAGRRRRKDTSEYWQLKYNKAKIKPSNFSHIFYDRKGRMYVDLYNPTKGDFYNVKFKDENIRPLDEDMRQWFITDMEWRETTFKKGPGIWEKYGGVISVMLLAFAFMLLFIGYAQFIEGAAGPLLGAAQALQGATQNLIQAANSLQSGGISIVPPS